LEEHSDWNLALIAKQPDLTLEEILAAMAKQGIPGSRSALQRLIAVFRLPHRGALHSIKRPSMNHIRSIGLKNFPDRLSKVLY
jgi:hypothetical protein